MATELREAYAGQGTQVDYDLTRYVVSQQRAIHFGLMVNELDFERVQARVSGGPGTNRRACRVALREEEEHLRLVVEDNGVGLPDEL